MKKFLLIFSVISTLLASCSNDDNMNFTKPFPTFQNEAIVSGKVIKYYQYGGNNYDFRTYYKIPLDSFYSSTNTVTNVTVIAGDKIVYEGPRRNCLTFENYTVWRETFGAPSLEDYKSKDLDIKLIIEYEGSSNQETLLLKQDFIQNNQALVSCN